MLMAFLNAVRWVKHARGTQQINDSHPLALAYEIDSHELENASHFAMRISLFSSLTSTTTLCLKKMHHTNFETV